MSRVDRDDGYGRSRQRAQAGEILLGVNRSYAPRGLAVKTHAVEQTAGGPGGVNNLSALFEKSASNADTSPISVGDNTLILSADKVVAAAVLVAVQRTIPVLTGSFVGAH